MDSFWFYKKALILGKPFLNALLARRLHAGKEDPERLSERKGIPSLPRPNGPLIWVHVASVGEAQSVLSLIQLLLDQNSQLHILVTSGTRTSAGLLATKLPPRAIHQYVPIDHPDWVRSFFDHWNPSMALWVESELWPNMLTMLKKRHIPAALLNAHMSPSSHKNWKRVPDLARKLLSVFLVILAQSRQDAAYYSEFNAHSVVITDNIKYAAKPLSYREEDLAALKSAIGARPVWLYASTHKGEEELAAIVHKKLRSAFPDLLTIIAPRHPDRRQEILETIESADLKPKLRGVHHNLPSDEDDIYIADTMGELGLFYKFAPMAVIGRSFSDDGGGGHNPIEAALHQCAVLHGPNVQNLALIFEEMDEASAAMKIAEKTVFPDVIASLLQDTEKLQKLQTDGYNFSKTKADVLKRVIDELEPVFLEAQLPVPKVPS